VAQIRICVAVYEAGHLKCGKTKIFGNKNQRLDLQRN